MRVNIIGGGLAGCALAYVLKQAGAQPVIYEAGPRLASGASGNEVGLYNPRFTAQLDAVGSFYSKAFFESLKVFEEFGDEIDWTPCGALHLMTNDQKKKRFPKTVESWNWSLEDMRLVNAQEASSIAGIEIVYDALYLSRSGTVSPRKLCARYARDVEVHLNHHIEDLSHLAEDVTILACGVGALGFEGAAHLPLKVVRGQVSYAKPTEMSCDLNVTIGYGGYISPVKDGVHCIGSTFQRWLNHRELMPEDDEENFKKAIQNVPSLNGLNEKRASWAGLRTTSRDHFPVVGQLSENLYVSTAHGSHGVLSTLISAKILSKNIAVPQLDMSSVCVDALRPCRFN